MDQRLLKILGGETRFYPHALETRYPRIFAKIMTLWDHPGIADYFMDLMVSDRENRDGFPPDIASEIMRLSLVHASSHKSNKKPDVWDIPADKFANFKPPVPVEMTDKWEALPAAKEKALERLGIPGTARGFHRAAESGNRAAVSIFLEARVSTEIHDERGWTPLMHAAYKGHNDVIGVLLKNQANMHAIDILGNTALHWAIDAGQTVSAKLLVDNRAAVDASNKSGITPLFIATERRHLGGLLLLIDSGANLNLIIREGSTALHKAAASGFTEIVRTLVHHGADMSIKDIDGNLPLTLALKSNQQDVIKLLRSGPKVNNAAAL